MSEASLAYLDLLADDRFETRLPRRLKRDAEAVARSLGCSLSEYVLKLMAERVAEDLPQTQEWRLTPTEQATLLKVLAAATQPSKSLTAARKRSKKLLGPNP